VGRGGQVGGVGFGDDVLKGYLIQESGNSGFLERDDAVDAQKESLVSQLQGLFQVAGEAVENALEAFGVVASDDGHDFVEGVPDVDQDGLVAFQGPVKLNGKGFNLLVQEGFVPVEVETDFTDAGVSAIVYDLSDFSQVFAKIFGNVSWVKASEETEKVWIEDSEFIHLG